MLVLERVPSGGWLSGFLPTGCESALSHIISKSMSLDFFFFWLIWKVAVLTRYNLISISVKGPLPPIWKIFFFHFCSVQVPLLGYLFIYLLFCFLGPYLRHKEVPRLGVESELQLPACTKATAVRDPSRVCDLHHSTWQRWILKPGIQPASSWIVVGFITR